MSEKWQKVLRKSRRLQGKERTRVVCFVVWPESVNIETLDRLIDSAHIQAARSPIHDRDIYDRGDVESWFVRNGFEADMNCPLDVLYRQAKAINVKGLHVPWIGDLKKPHYHYVLAFEGSKTAAQIVEILGGLVTYIEKVDTKEGTLKYLIHRNNPEKAQYDFDDIKVFGGMDISAIVKQGEIERIDTKIDIVRYINEHDVRSYNQLVSWAMGTRDYSVIGAVFDRKYLFDGYIVSRNMDMAERREHELWEDLERWQDKMSMQAAVDFFTEKYGYEVAWKLVQAADGYEPEDFSTKG